MSEHHFGVGIGKLRDAARRRIDAVAERHGCSFHNPTLPEGPRYWFAGPNRGTPFDERMGTAVYADLEREGLLDESGLARRLFL